MKGHDGKRMVPMYKKHSLELFVSIMRHTVYCHTDIVRVVIKAIASSLFMFVGCT